MNQGCTEQGSNTIGKGSFTIKNLSSPEHLRKKMISLGTTEDVMDYILSTSAPIGHEKHLTQTEAAKRFGFKRPINAELKSRRAFKILISELLYGDFLRTQEKQAATESLSMKNIGRIPVTIEQKAQKEAEKVLRAAYRRQHHLSPQGKISVEDQEQCSQYVKDNLAATTQRFEKEMREHLGIPSKKVGRKKTESEKQPEEVAEGTLV